MKKEISLILEGMAMSLFILQWGRISATGGRFPIEQRRVRFAVFLRRLQKLRQRTYPARNASLLLANAVLRDGVRRSRRLSLQSFSSLYFYLKDNKKECIFSG